MVGRVFYSGNLVIIESEKVIDWKNSSMERGVTSGLTLAGVSPIFTRVANSNMEQKRLGCLTWRATYQIVLTDAMLVDLDH